MPTYVYECTKCGHRFEVLQSITDPPRRRCPRCRRAVKRLLMPGGGFIFKGSGFYITDYRKKEAQAAAETGEGSAGEKPADTRPDAGAPDKKGKKEDAGGASGS